MSVRIVIDSASDITKEKADALGLDLMPLKTIFGDEEYLDGVTLSHHEFYEKLIESGIFPTTSQIPPHEFEYKFKEIKEAGDTAVVITLSSLLSGTYQSAHLALDGYEDCIHLVDSKNLCIGEQNLVMYAIRLRDQGCSAEEIVSELEDKKSKICVLAVFDTLEYLKRGGRLSSTAAWAGNLLSIKPVISAEKGEIVILGKARGSKNGNNLLIQQVAAHGGIDFTMPHCLGYTGLDDTMLQKYLKDSASLWDGKVAIEDIPISTVGSTIGTHAGPGAIAVSFFHP
ncbi:MAG: DegV family protein [Agathobacter sp.]|nr:DegV family protein [Agathobacter sp.]